MTNTEWAKLSAAVERMNQRRNELLDIIRDGVAFVNRAAHAGGGNDIHQCRAMNRRFRMARLLLTPAKSKKGRRA